MNIDVNTYGGFEIEYSVDLDLDGGLIGFSGSAWSGD